LISSAIFVGLSRGQGTDMHHARTGKLVQLKAQTGYLAVQQVMTAPLCRPLKARQNQMSAETNAGTAMHHQKQPRVTGYTASVKKKRQQTHHILNWN